MSSFRGSSQPRDQTQVSCTGGRFFTISATSEAHHLHSSQTLYVCNMSANFPCLKSSEKFVKEKETAGIHKLV